MTGTVSESIPVPPLVELERRLAEAKTAARLAGRLQAEADARSLTIRTKASPIDLVTEVDQACDAAIRDYLQARFPDDVYLTEETYQAGQPIDLSRTWIVDPIDGTTNFAHGFPHYAAAIAYAVAGEPMLGVVYDVNRDELFSAIRGQGAWVEKAGVRKRLAVSAVDALERALLATGFPADKQTSPLDNLPYFEAFLSRCHGVRRPGSAALDLTYVAAGRLDGFWEFRLAPWDVAAGALFVQEAGGQVSDPEGAPLRFDQRHVSILAANRPAMLDAIVEGCQAVKARLH